VKVLLAAATAVALATAAVASAGPTSTPPTMHPGVLTVGLDPPAVGFQVGTLRGQKVLNPRGYEIDVAKGIAAQLKIGKINYVKVPFAVLFRPGTKPFDLAFEESTITVARSRAVSFSTSYFAANQGVLVSKKIDSEGKTPKSLSQLKQLQICAQAVTTGLDYVQHRLHPTKRPQIFQTTAAAFTAVQNGSCDAFVMDVPIVASQKKTKPSAYGPVAGQIITNEKYGAVMTKGSKLKPFVDRAIKTLTSNGSIAKWQKKWFNINFSKLHVLR
jgi:polar amino acid transport system substrate-binding protein